LQGKIATLIVEVDFRCC